MRPRRVSSRKVEDLKVRETGSFTGILPGGNAGDAGGEA
jgi:hypothetical protein